MRWPVPEHERDQLVVAERVGADAHELLARADPRAPALVLRSAPPSPAVYSPRCRVSAARLRHVAPDARLAVTLVACAEPPTREISQAQGALDAARAAGAEAYAKTEFQAADAALQTCARRRQRARLSPGALGFALEAREQARDRRPRSRGRPRPRRHRGGAGHPGRGPCARGRAHAARRPVGRARCACAQRVRPRRPSTAQLQEARSAIGRGRLCPRGGARAERPRRASVSCCRQPPARPR